MSQTDSEFVTYIANDVSSFEYVSRETSDRLHRIAARIKQLETEGQWKKSCLCYRQPCVCGPDLPKDEEE